MLVGLGSGGGGGFRGSVICLSVIGLLLVLMSVSSLVYMSESLLVPVLVLDSASEWFVWFGWGSLGVFQVVALVEESVTVSFCIRVRSACSMSHSESMTYLRCAVGYASMDLSYLIILRLSVYRWISHEIEIASVISSS